MKNKESILKEINTFQDKTLCSHLGIEIIDIADNYVCGKMPVDKRTKQPFGLLHGGASAVLAETLGSIGANRLIDNDSEMVVGIEISANHVKSVKDGYVYGKTVPIKVSKKLQIWEIRITNEEGKIICISKLTAAVIKRKN